VEEDSSLLDGYSVPAGEYLSNPFVWNLPKFKVHYRENLKDARSSEISGTAFPVTQRHIQKESNIPLLL
jgi:hypothetical protein